MADDGICGVCHRIDEENSEILQIQCDSCNRWYHCRCVNLEEYETDDIDRYHCDKCVKIYGPSKQKLVTNRHRHDYSEPDPDNKPIQSGTYQFVHNLKRRQFPELSYLMTVMDNGYDFNFHYLESCSFTKPVLVKNVEGLGMVVPESSVSVDEISQLVDPDYEVDVIDVQRQHSYKMKFSAFHNFFRQPKRRRVYNLISFEFSGTRMTNLLKLPSLVEEISWVSQYWPKKFDTSIAGGSKELSVLNEHVNIRPEVSKFCLISMRDSYTDFHIDFGGTSVWYHVISGEKWFYLVEPTDSNLALYEDWSHSTNKSEKFFGDEVDRCYISIIKSGQTLFIPTGWIHAVMTPVDSLVFGGNFLHSFNIPLQLRIYEMELNASTPEKFMFPHFELLNWYAGLHFLDVLKDANDEKVAVKSYLTRGIRSLISAMKRWIARNQSATWPLAKKGRGLKGGDKVETVTCAQLLKSLEKTLTTNEKFLTSKKQQQKRRQESVSPKKSVNNSKSPSSNAKATNFGPTKIVPGSFINAKRIEKMDSVDLPGCPKSPVKISLKPGVWSLPIIKPEEEASSLSSSASSSVTSPLKIKLSLGDTSADEAAKSLTPKKVSAAESPAPSSSSSVPRTPDFFSSPSVEHNVPNTPISLIDSPSLQPPPSPPPPSSSFVASPARKKVGFSLLDLNKIPSPPSTTNFSTVVASPPPTVESKTDVAHQIAKQETTTATNVSSSAAVPLSQKLKLKIPKVKKVRTKSTTPKSSDGTHLSGIFGVSKHGRVQKPNQKVLGETGKSTEFVPELGQCRKDEEFIYPPLVDSDEESRLSRKRPKDDSSPAFIPPGKFSLASFGSTIQSPKKKAKKKDASSSEKQKILPKSSTSSSDSHPTTASTVLPTASAPSTDAVVGDGQKLTASGVPKSSALGMKTKKKVTTAKQRLASKLKLHKMIPTL